MKDGSRQDSSCTRIVAITNLGSYEDKYNTKHLKLEKSSYEGVYKSLESLENDRKIYLGCCLLSFW